MSRGFGTLLLHIVGLMSPLQSARRERVGRQGMPRRVLIGGVPGYAQPLWKSGATLFSVESFDYSELMCDQPDGQEPKVSVPRLYGLLTETIGGLLSL